MYPIHIVLHTWYTYLQLCKHCKESCLSITAVCQGKMCQPTWKLWILKEKRFSITTGWNYSKCWQISGGVFSSLAKVFPQVVLLLLPGKSPEVSHHNNNEGRVTSARYKDMKLSKANFDNILLHMDSAVVGVWLKRANDSVKILASWPYDGRWQLRCAHFWLL